LCSEFGLTAKVLSKFDSDDFVVLQGVPLEPLVQVPGKPAVSAKDPECVVEKAVNGSLKSWNFLLTDLWEPCVTLV